jgi:hypothetical protein
LSAPFTPEEVKCAFLFMNKLSSPGPDGFGPAFFSSFWATVASDVCELFSSFYDGTIDLAHINRAFLVLLPKVEAATHPSQFRPISLQNCVMKAITKVLTTRLQAAIQTLVDGVTFWKTLSMRLTSSVAVIRVERQPFSTKLTSEKCLTRLTGKTSFPSLGPVASTTVGAARWKIFFARASRPSSLTESLGTGSAAGTTYARGTLSPPICSSSWQMCSSA